jgi:hypothetical protein
VRTSSREAGGIRGVAGVRIPTQRPHVDGRVVGGATVRAQQLRCHVGESAQPLKHVLAAGGYLGGGGREKKGKGEGRRATPLLRPILSSQRSSAASCHTPFSPSAVPREPKQRPPWPPFPLSVRAQGSLPCPRQPTPHLARKAKVNQLELSVLPRRLIDEVVQLNVPMHHPVQVAVPDGAKHLLDQAGGRPLVVAVPGGGRGGVRVGQGRGVVGGRT